MGARARAWRLTQHCSLSETYVFYSRFPNESLWIKSLVRSTLALVASARLSRAIMLTISTSRSAYCGEFKLSTANRWSCEMTLPQGYRHRDNSSQ